MWSILGDSMRRDVDWYWLGQRRPSINQWRESGWVGGHNWADERNENIQSRSSLAHNWLIYGAVIVAAAAAPDLYSLFRTRRLYCPCWSDLWHFLGGGVVRALIRLAPLPHTVPRRALVKRSNQRHPLSSHKFKGFFVRLLSLKAGHFSLSPAALKVELFKGNWAILDWSMDWNMIENESGFPHWGVMQQRPGNSSTWFCIESFLGPSN